jgi:DNA-binding SARP family transcriptional activator
VRGIGYVAAKFRDRMDTLASTAAETVYIKTKDRRIIALYPKHRQHASLISLLHNHYTDRLFYFTLSDEDDESLKAFVLNLTHDAMFPIEFGTNTRTALQEEPDSPYAWGEGLARDLAELQLNDHFLVLLENFDRLPRDDEAVEAFFTGLGENLPQNAQFLVNGKELRKQPWAALSNKGLAIALGDDETLGSGIFQEPALRGQLEIYALAGGSRVLIDGRPLTAWEGSLPRNLFHFFVDKTRVTRAEIFEAFWPSMGVKEATNVFHVTKRKISEKIGYDLTAYENGFYIPNNQLNRLYDVAVFEDNIEAANNAANAKEVKGHWSRAVQVYRGQFLKDVDMPWAIERRQELRQMYIQALIGLARIYADQGDSDLALAYYIRAAGEQPDREDVHREIMQLYADRGALDKVAAQYDLLSSMLEERLELAPSDETRKLYKKLTR